MKTIDKLVMDAIELGFSNNKTIKYEKSKLLYELQFWLRTKHNIYIESIISNGPKFDLVIMRLTSDMANMIYYKGWIYNSYEDAITKGIRETLKLIKKL